MSEVQISEVSQYYCSVISTVHFLYVQFHQNECVQISEVCCNPIRTRGLQQTLSSTYVRKYLRTYVACLLTSVITPFQSMYKCMYSQTSLVSTPGDPPNCYSLSVVLANQID